MSKTAPKFLAGHKQGDTQIQSWEHQRRRKFEGKTCHIQFYIYRVGKVMGYLQMLSEQLNIDLELKRHVQTQHRDVGLSDTGGNQRYVAEDECSKSEEIQGKNSNEHNA